MALPKRTAAADLKIRNADLTLQEEDSVGTANNILGFTVVRQAGEKIIHDPKAVIFGSYPVTATKISQGAGTWDDATLPNKTEPQDDWAGGYGQLKGDDKSRLFDMSNLGTQLRGRMILGPQATFVESREHVDSSRYAQPAGNSIESYSPTGVTFHKLHTVASGGDSLYVSGGVGGWKPDPAGYTVMFWLRKIGSPGDLSINQRGSSLATGLPSTSINGETHTVSDHPYSDDRTAIIKVYFATRGAVGADYQLSFSGSGVADEDNHWEIAVDKDAYPGSGPGSYDTPMAISEDGSNWTLGTKRPYHIFYPDIDGKGMFFSYKMGTYYVGLTSSFSVGVQMFGDRGEADNNSSDTTKLFDATKAWRVNEWTGAVVVLIGGPGSKDDTPYRTITSNDVDEITVDLAWETLHTTSTKYVILGADIMERQATLPDSVTSCVVIGDNIFFAFGEDANIIRARHKSDGTWETYTESIKADILTVYKDPSDGLTYLYGSASSHEFYNTAIWRAYVPLRWVDATNTGLGVIDATLLDIKASGDWLGYKHANVAVTTDGGKVSFTPSGSQSGHFGIKQIAAANVANGGGPIGFYAKVDSGTYGDLKVKLANRGNKGLNEYTLADFVYLLKTTQAPASVLAGAGSTVFELENLTKLDDDLTVDYTFEDAHRFYIGAPFRFDNVKIEFASYNAQAKTMDAAEVFVKDEAAGGDWLDILAEVTDGTLSGGAGWAQDGAYVIDLTDAEVERWTTGADGLDSGLDASLYYLNVGYTGLLDEVSIKRIRVWNSITGEASIFIPASNANDGSNATESRIYRLATDEYLYVGNLSRYNEIKFNFSSTVNGTAATLSGGYFNKEVFASLSITDGTETGGKTMAQDGSITFDMPNDMDVARLGGVDADVYWTRFNPSAEIDDFTLVEVSVKNDHWLTLAIATLTDEYKWFEQDIGIAHDDDPIVEAISFYADVGTTAVISIFGMVQLMSSGPKYWDVPDEQINNLIVYGDNIQNVRVFTERTMYEHQSESGYQLVEIPLGELGALRSIENAKAVVVNDVYIWFNIGEMTQRYFNRSLENIGWTREEGLPETRQGRVVKYVSAPGRVLALISTRNTYDSTSAGYSSVQEYNNGGWHEIWRGPKNARAWDMHFETIEGASPHRLWIALDGLMLWLPIATALNPLNDSLIRYTHEGYGITSWLNGGPMGIEKLWRTFTAFIEKLASSTPRVYVRVEYQVDEGEIDGTWTEIDGDFDSTYRLERNLGQTTTVGTELSTASVTGHRIRFRVRLFTEDASITPILHAYITKLIVNFPPQFEMELSVRVADEGDPYTDESGNQDLAQRAETVMSTLKTWYGEPPVALRLRIPFSPYDDTKVLLQPITGRPFDLDSANQLEEHVFRFRILEISDTATVPA